MSPRATGPLMMLILCESTSAALTAAYICGVPLKGREGKGRDGGMADDAAEGLPFRESCAPVCVGAHFRIQRRSRAIRAARLIENRFHSVFNLLFIFLPIRWPLRCKTTVVVVFFVFFYLTMPGNGSYIQTKRLLLHAGPA